VANGVVYHAFMGADCPRSPSARGLIVAMDARTGKVLWKQDTPVVESSLVVVDGTLYYGAWDAHVYAMDARTHRIKWSRAVDSSVTDSAAYHQGTVFIGTDHGGFYALDARTGAVRWQNSSFAKFGSREYFYATPSVAYGRVYASNTDGYVYSFGEKTGKLRWARHVGSYVYSGVAIQNRTLYVGSYSGELVVLDAATGDVKWRFAAPAAVHGTPSIIDGVVYFATLSGYHPGAARTIKNGPGITLGVDIKTHRQVFRGAEGRYVAMIADEHRLYWVGRKHLTALEPKG
jgi:outer membrane protein assembly factor BamB